MDAQFMSKFNELVADIGEIKLKMTEVTSIKSIVTESKKNLEELQSTVTEIKTDSGELKTKINKLEIENEKLNSKINELEQYGRKNNIIIIGIPQTDDEDIVGIILNLAGKLKVDINEHHISAAHRLRARGNKTAPIIVKLNSLIKRTKLIRNSKQMKIESTVLGFEDRLPIFINEDLTSQNVVLFSKALEFKRNGHIESTWTFNGKIFLRKFPNEAPVTITNINQLNEIAMFDGIEEDNTRITRSQLNRRENPVQQMPVTNNAKKSNAPNTTSKSKKITKR